MSEIDSIIKFYMRLLIKNPLRNGEVIVNTLLDSQDTLHDLFCDYLKWKITVE